MTTTPPSGPSRSKRAAGALSLAAVCCGTIAFLGAGSSAPQHELASSPPSPLESSPLAAHLPPASPLPSSAADDDSRLRTSQHQRHGRRLSKALPDGGCEITWPVKPPPDVQITYAASYPGCGARMTWNLVEALTGLWTGDDWNNNGRGEEVVTVKTHFPQSNGILVEFDEKIQRGFIVIRNPMKSIPSFFNHIYEMRNHLPVHSERAPLEEWIKWRNAYLETEIAEYKKFIIYWMDRYTPENRLLITYEGLTDDLIGAEVTKGLNEFLGKARGVTPIASESVPCIWRAVVKNEPPAQQRAQIEKLQALARNEPQGGYRGGPPPQSAVQRQQTEVLPGQQQQQPQGLSNAEILEQTLRNIQNAPIGGGAGGGGGQELDQQLLDAQSKLQFVQQQIKALQSPAQPAAPVPDRGLSLEEQLRNTQAQLLEAQSLNRQYAVQPGLRRRLDPGHHNSQRAGPEVPRPYTPEQLDKMMAMLVEVAQRYERQDVRLYHIMMGYYEQIRGERAKLSLDGSDGVRPPGGFY